MYYPHTRFDRWFPRGSAAAIEAACADCSERSFTVTFAVENSATGEFLDSFLELPKIVTRTVAADGVRIKAIFYPNGYGRLGHISCHLASGNRMDAFKQCYEWLSRLFSFLSVSSGCALALISAVVEDDRHAASWSSASFHPLTEQFGLPPGLALSCEQAALISLYREGKTNLSSFYRFLCFYKILEAWVRGRSAFGCADGYRPLLAREGRRVTKDTYAGLPPEDGLAELEGKTYDELLAYFGETRARVAGAVCADDGFFLNFDKVASVAQLNSFANFLDKVVQQILADELLMWRQVAEGGVFPGGEAETWDEYADDEAGA